MKNTWYNRLACKLFGHKERYVIELRYHCSGVKCGKHSYQFGGYGAKRSNKGRWVDVSYKECSRCGKKLTNAKRVTY